MNKMAQYNDIKILSKATSNAIVIAYLSTKKERLLSSIV